MAINTGNIRAYGDISQRVVTSPIGGGSAPTAPLPTMWGAGWSEFGALTDDGVTFAQNQQETQVYIWQGGSVGRVLRSQFEKPFSIVCAEENAVTQGLYFPGSTVTSTGGTSTIQTVTITGTGTAGTWTFGPATALPFNVATTALPALLNTAYGATGFAVTGTAGTSYVITFPMTMGNVAKASVAQAITGASAIANVVTTPGANAVNTRAIAGFSGQNLRQFGIDLVDGTVHRRFYIPNGEAVPTGSVSLKGSAGAFYSFDITPYPDSTGELAYDINDNPALAAGLFV